MQGARGEGYHSLNKLDDCSVINDVYLICSSLFVA